MAERVEGRDPGDNVREAYDEVKGAVGNLASEVKGKVDRTVRDVRAGIGGKGERAMSYARDRYDRARKDMDQLVTDVNGYVRDNPGRSILIAAGVGFVIGLLIRGRRRD